MSFIKQVLAAAIGVFIAMFFLFFIMVSSIATLVAGVKNVGDDAHIAENTVLKIDLKDPLKDHVGGIVFRDMNFPIDNDRHGLYDYILALHKASNDSRISGIYLTPKALESGFAQAKEFRNAIEKFKESGKFVYAYTNDISQKDYFLKSVADSIFLNPMGNLELKGIGAEIKYLKGFQDFVGIEMQVIRHGKYKSAVEPYMKNEISEANKEQIKAYIGGIWDDISTSISAKRQIRKETIDDLANNLSVRTSKDALDNKLVDGLLFFDEFEDVLRDKLYLSEGQEIPMVSLKKYTDEIIRENETNQSNNTIAVIYAQGVISYGRDSPKEIGQISMRKALRKVAEDEKVKGIVLRVDSPGGDALTSDIIWREVMRAKEQKPIFVSMGNVAASGGYYISCAGDRIFAEKSTITGSIGVFGIVPSVQKIAEKVGIHSERVSTHKHAINSVFVDLDNVQKDYIKSVIENIYNVFLTRVSQGRNMSKEAVDKIAQGRVYTGTDALKVGLVDSIGGLHTTITSLAKELDLPNYKIESYPRGHEIDDLEDILEVLGKEVSTSIIEKMPLGKVVDSYVEGFRREDPIVQAMMPFDIRIE